MRAVLRIVVPLLALAAGMACANHSDPGPSQEPAAETPAPPATEPAAEPVRGGEERTCGGIQGLPCAEGEVCDLPAGECQSADLFGVCVTRPEVCTMIFAPVCGCDDETYSNDCQRLMKGVQKDHDGECGGNASV